MRTGIKKLRAVYVIKAKDEATKTVRLWRGMRNLDVGDKFIANHTGGTEVAPMSTTTDMRVAVHYGLSAGSLLFLLKVDNFLQYGAELQWLSAFPGEAEVLPAQPRSSREISQFCGPSRRARTLPSGQVQQNAVATALPRFVALAPADC